MADIKTVIAGYSEMKNGLKLGRSAFDLAGEVYADLLAKTGLAPQDIDGLSVALPISEAGNVFFGAYMSEALGITPTWLNTSGMGGCSVIAGIARAQTAIREGSCKIALIIAADAPSQSGRVHHGAYRAEFSDPTGVQAAPAAFGLLMSRYQEQYGLDTHALAKIAVTQREHACLNANALEKLRKPITVEDYFQSRVIADPLRVLDCVMFCDGANAFVVMAESEAKARGLHSYVTPTAFAEVTNHNGQLACPDITDTGFWRIGPSLLAKAGVRPADIDMFQPYDDFTIAVMMQLEAFGFCARGQGSAYVMDSDLSYRGTLPVNTGGGQISAGQPGLAGGGLNMAEAVRQLMGEGEGRQISSPKKALVTGIGTIPYARNWASSAAMILEV
jgi:acetyl-CoA acetyltransferase